MAAPNLLAEAALYCHSDDPAERKAEIPVDEHNHAISALRYLISKLDARGLKRKPDSEPTAAPPQERKPDPWCNYRNEALWTREWPAE